MPFLNVRSPQKFLGNDVVQSCRAGGIASSRFCEKFPGGTYKLDFRRAENTSFEVEEKGSVHLARTSIDVAVCASFSGPRLRMNLKK